MDMMKVSEAAERWGVTPRFVQMLCKEGRISGARQWGRAWMIPSDATYPTGGASNQVTAETANTDQHEIFNRVKRIYTIAGTADVCTELVSEHRDSQLILAAGFAYLRGEIDQAIAISREIIAKSNNFQCKVSAGLRLGLCAIWKGDIEMWNEGKQAIFEASRQNSEDSEENDAIAELSLASVNGAIHDTSQFPEWFRMGCFDRLPIDLMASAKVLYAKYLYSTAYAIASGQTQREGIRENRTNE